MSSLSVKNIVNPTTADSTPTDNLSKQVCKAWVNFDGTGVPTIRDSYNVASITDNGTGDYTVNFSTPMSDANYSVSTTASNAANNTLSINYAYNQSISSVDVITRNATDWLDRPLCCLQVFSS